VQALNVLLGAVCLLWAVECVARRRRPEVPRAPTLLVLMLLVHGWWMALNAHHQLVQEPWHLAPHPQWVTGAPGSADGATSISAMLTYSGLLGALLFCCELVRRPTWRRRLWVTLALTGFSIALFGVMQKVGGDAVLALTWEPEKRDPINNFALFRYRANAGAWLNLVLPLLATLVFVSFHKRQRPWSKALGIAALLVVLAGIQLNPSRASWAIALGLLLALLARVAWHYWQRRSDGTDRKAVAVYGTLGAAALGALAAIVVWGGWLTGWQRLGREGADLSTRQPTEIFLRMVPDAGWTGYGPGTFQVVFPAYQAAHDFGGRPIPAFWTSQRWIHAHHDYFQTLIEWGYVGGLLWAALIGGGLVVGVVKLVRLQSEFSLRWLLLGAVLALMGVLVHATMDFPLQVASIQLYVAVLLGLCWGAKADRPIYRAVRASAS
jgi:O-antigen ligase